MLTTKNLVDNYKQVESIWIFEHFCSLSEKLIGQDIKIHSLFNLKDRTPSMCIYIDKNRNTYKFKDFSTGKQGDAINLVMELLGLNFSQAATLIVEEYNEFVLHNNGGYNVDSFKVQSKYKVIETVSRSWNVKDQKFWTQFHIGTTFLKEYNVVPLESYTMHKEEEVGNKTLIIKGEYIYGYFNNAGEICKIYQPRTKDKKFIKVKDYIQGSDQLKGHSSLLIASSLKDIGSLKALKLNIDFVAPDSENSMISKDQITRWKKKYKKIITLLDNDEAGIKAMQKYRDTHALPCILLTLSKDVSDSIRDHGPILVRDRIVPLINNIICE